jgi:hypothetical protein
LNLDIEEMVEMTRYTARLAYNEIESLYQSWRKFSEGETAQANPFIDLAAKQMGEVALRVRNEVALDEHFHEECDCYDEYLHPRQYCEAVTALGETKPFPERWTHCNHFGNGEDIIDDDSIDFEINPLDPNGEAS